MAELAVNLEVHEAIQRNGRPGRTFDQHAVVADVTCHDRRELGVAASIFPNDLTGDRELAVKAAAERDEYMKFMDDQKSTESGESKSAMALAFEKALGKKP